MADNADHAHDRPPQGSGLPRVPQARLAASGTSTAARWVTTSRAPRSSRRSSSRSRRPIRSAATTSRRTSTAAVRPVRPARCASPSRAPSSRSTKRTAASCATSAFSRATHVRSSARSPAVRRHASGSSSRSASSVVSCGRGRRDARHRGSCRSPSPIAVPQFTSLKRSESLPGADAVGGTATMTCADDQPNEVITCLTMQPTLEALLAAGVHFGHQTRRWNPKMRRFIFAERNGIHIIDLQKTLRQLELAQKLVRDVVLRGDNVLFVCTKRAARRHRASRKPSAAAPCTSPSAGSAACSPTSRR